MYLSDAELLFCLIGSELGREWSGLRDGCLTRAAGNKIDSKSHTGNLLSSFLLIFSIWPAVSPWLPGGGVTSHPGSAVGVQALAKPPDQLALGLMSRQKLRRGLRGCLGSGMREGGTFWVRAVGETAAVGCGWRPDKRGDADEAVTGEDASRGASSSPQDLLLLGKEGEPGGVRIWMPSPSEEERLLLAMELAVGFM